MLRFCRQASSASQTMTGREDVQLHEHTSSLIEIHLVQINSLME